LSEAWSRSQRPPWQAISAYTVTVKAETVLVQLHVPELQLHQHQVKVHEKGVHWSMYHFAPELSTIVAIVYRRMIGCATSCVHERSCIMFSCVLSCCKVPCIILVVDLQCFVAIPIVLYLAENFKSRLVAYVWLVMIKACGAQHCLGSTWARPVKCMATIHALAPTQSSPKMVVVTFKARETDW